jgi:hypothetical protein
VTSKQSFAEWVADHAPPGVDEQSLLRVRRCMARDPANRGITSQGDLFAALRHLRVFYDNEHSWQRFLLTAKHLLAEYRERTRK